MRSIITYSFSTILLLASFAHADDLKPYQTGKLLQMDSVPCNVAHAKSPQAHCLQYILEADSVVFHLRPKNAKHAAVLPVGERAQFRIEKGRILMHMDGVDNRERQYVVVSLAPRSDNSSADAAPVRLNHLQ
ncbi:MAG: hypothetical protein WA485_19400 [Candidatus Sulfotelmatobacter sp.]